MAANSLVDMIPLHEITCVSEMKELEEKTSPCAQSNRTTSWSTKMMNRKNSILDDEKINRAEVESMENESKSFLQIKTKADGFNSGREYYLQARSTDQCLTIVHKLTKAVDSAKAEVEVPQMFRTTQKKLRMIYNTMAFQLMVAFLIITVRTRIRLHIDIRLFPLLHTSL
jgi:hypothetical protein